MWIINSSSNWISLHFFDEKSLMIRIFTWCSVSNYLLSNSSLICLSLKRERATFWMEALSKEIVSYRVRIRSCQEDWSHPAPRSQDKSERLGKKHGCQFHGLEDLICTYWLTVKNHVLIASKCPWFVDNLDLVDEVCHVKELPQIQPINAPVARPSTTTYCFWKALMIKFLFH